MAASIWIRAYPDPTTCSPSVHVPTSTQVRGSRTQIKLKFWSPSGFKFALKYPRFAGSRFVVSDRKTYPLRLKSLAKTDTAGEVGRWARGDSLEPHQRENVISFNHLAEADRRSGQDWKQGISFENSNTPALDISSLRHDVGITLLVMIGAYAWVRLFNYFTQEGYLEQKLSRKLVHITSGLLYMICWPFFSVWKGARFMAALVPLLNAFRLLIFGFGLLKDEGLVKSVSREGDAKELLRGPLFYVMVLILSTVFFWRGSPVGTVALAMMCGGDGIADIIGRNFGVAKLPYNKGKSWAGSIAMLAVGFVLSYGSILYFSALGFYHLNLSTAAGQVAFISLAATVVESLPISSKLDDNITVPFTSVALGMLLFPM